MVHNVHIHILYTYTHIIASDFALLVGYVA